jgi:hypothetical protein
VSFVLFGFIAHQHNLGTGKLILAYQVCYKLKAKLGVKTTSKDA